MREVSHTHSGLDSIGDLAWGAHFCHFYRSRDDLGDTLVPYFRAGLEAGEQCLWVTAEPLRAADAHMALAASVRDLDGRVAAGDIEIIDHEEWYLRFGHAGADSVLDQWMSREQRALATGKGGLRLTGNTFWLDRSDWRSFGDYEARVNRAFKDRRIVALCSYCLDRCALDDMLDVVENHDFALARRDGAWRQFESSTLAITRAKLAEVNSDLERRVVERTAELQAALEVRDDFLSVASHELKTPITALKLYVEGLSRAMRKRALDPEELLRRLTKAEEQCSRLDELLGTLLDVSRARSGHFAIAAHDVDFGEIAATVRDRFADEMARGGRSLTLIGPASLPGASDGMRVEQVLTNLTGNAVKHAPGSPVELALAEDGDDVVFTVRDRGPGIPADQQTRIFERFHQRAESRALGGFGLGLWIVQRIVSSMHGSIAVESELGRGATFTVRLPRRLAQE